MSRRTIKIEVPRGANDFKATFEPQYAEEKLSVRLDGLKAENERLEKTVTKQRAIIDLLWRCIHVDNSLIKQYKLPAPNKQKINEFLSEREKMSEDVEDLEAEILKL